MRLRNGTVATAIIFFTSFLSLSWYTAWQNGKGKAKAKSSRGALLRLAVSSAYVRGGETSEFSACLGGFFLCVCPGLVARLVVDTVPSACRVTAGCCCVSRRVHRVFRFNSFLPPDSHATICGHLHSEVVRQLKHAGAAFSQGFLFFFIQF